MWEQLEARFLDIIRPLFRTEAEFNRIPNDDLRFRVQWKLNNDPNRRPQMRSRRIILNVSREKLQDDNCSDHMSDALEREITNEVKKRLKAFNPNHDTPIGQPEPEEQWEL